MVHEEALEYISELLVCPSVGLQSLDHGRIL